MVQVHSLTCPARAGFWAGYRYDEETDTWHDMCKESGCDYGPRVPLWKMRVCEFCDEWYHTATMDTVTDYACKDCVKNGYD